LYVSYYAQISLIFFENCSQFYFGSRISKSFTHEAILEGTEAFQIPEPSVLTFTRDVISSLKKMIIQIEPIFLVIIPDVISLNDILVLAI
jgi:hypothetical protein